MRQFKSLLTTIIMVAGSPALAQQATLDESAKAEIKAEMQQRIEQHKVSHPALAMIEQRFLTAQLQGDVEAVRKINSEYLQQMSRENPQHAAKITRMTQITSSAERLTREIQAAFDRGATAEAQRLEQDLENLMASTGHDLGGNEQPH